MDLHTACKHTASSQTCHKNITQRRTELSRTRNMNIVSAFTNHHPQQQHHSLALICTSHRKMCLQTHFYSLALVIVGWLLPKYGWPALRTETSLAWTEDIWLWVKTQSHDMSPQLSWAQCVCLLACSMFGTDGVIWELWLSCGWVCARVRFPGSVGNLSPQFTLRTSRSPRQHFSPQKQQR